MNCFEVIRQRVNRERGFFILSPRAGFFKEGHLHKDLKDRMDEPLINAREEWQGRVKINSSSIGTDAIL